MGIKRIVHIPTWIWGELVWYFKWWVCVIVLFFHRLYQFGEWILNTGVKLIDLHDQFWDEIDYKIDHWGDWNDLA